MAKRSNARSDRSAAVHWEARAAAVDTRAGAVRSATHKLYRRGTHRALSPQQTLERVAPLLRRAGVTRVANITGLDRIGIPVVTVCRPASRCLAVSQGKGATLAAAKASGVMESFEWLMAEQRRAPAAQGSYEELEARGGIVDPLELTRPLNGVYSPQLPLAWIDGRDLLTDERVLVPYDAISLDYTLEAPHRTAALAVAGNGLAAGNDVTEATVHALCEAIERDAAVLWQLRAARAQQSTRVALGSVDDPACCELLERFAAADVEVAVWDATSDVGLPCFVCRVIDGTTHFARGLVPGDGCGCHPSRAVALSRALTEAAQSRLTWISGARDEFFAADYVELRDPELLERQRAFILQTAGERSFRDVPDSASETFEEDIAHILERLTAVGLTRAIVVDLTGPPLDVPVVMAIVPGLEGPMAPEGYTRGRRAAGLVT